MVGIVATSLLTDYTNKDISDEYDRIHPARAGSEYRKFVEQISRAELEKVRRSIEKHKGNPREPRFDRLFADIDADNPPSSGGLTLRELIERYEKDPGRRSLTDKTRDT